jgi:hypothetical protein
VDAELEEVGALAKPVDRRACVGDEPRRGRAPLDQQTGGVVDDLVGRPVDVDRDGDVAHGP